MAHSVQITLHSNSWNVSFQPLSFMRLLTVGEKTADVPVPNCPIGARIECTLTEAGFRISAVGCRIQESPEGASEATGNQTYVYHVESRAGSMLFSMHVSIVPLASEPEYDRIVDVPVGKTVRIGAQADADIRVQHPLISGSVCDLIRNETGWIADNIGSIPIGLYVNTQKINRQTRIPAGAFLFAPGLSLYLEDDTLRMPSRDNVSIQALSYLDGSEQNSHLHYPCINRTSRRILNPPNEPVSIQDPPPPPEEQKRNLVISLLPALIMVGMTILLRDSFTSGMGTLLFSTASLAIGAVTSVITYIQTGKQSQKKALKRREIYEQYIQECEKKIQETRIQEAQLLHSIYIDPQQELQRIKDFSAELFDRRPSDNDFLDVMLGYGTLRSRQPVVCKTHEVFEAVDELFSLPQQLQQTYAFLEGLPSYVHGREACAVGIVGDIHSLRSLLRNISLDLFTRQSFEDVCLYYFLSDSFLPEKRALRMLPHVRNQVTGRRNIACDEESQALILDALFKELCAREAEPDAPGHSVWQVVFIQADDSPIMRHPLMGFIEKASSLHTLFVFFSVHQDLLPQGCTSLVQLASNINMGVLCSLTSNEPDQLFEYDAISDTRLSEATLRLAPVYSSEITLASHLSGNESLFSMLKIQNEDDLDVSALWKNADTTKHISAPLGIRDNGHVLELDLHEKEHGPHGLVAGTTGSGKSQVLISYILSLATRYSPEDVTFAVIDFKGGDIVKQLPGLPHIVGSITNLSKDEINRSLRSINAEKNKRMLLFDEEHANVSNISEYTAAYRAGKVDVPLPHLLIIVDEFAELRSQFPESMQELISIARVGRSLGIHIILCTQKPSGIVDGQIRSNSDFQLCLRVQTREDSNDVISSPLAAEIHEPGRGYLRVGRTEQFELFQSGYSGLPKNQGAQRKAFSLYSVDISGKKKLIYEQNPAESQENALQRDAVLQKVIQAYKASGIKQPSPLCLPSIPDLLPFGKGAGEPSLEKVTVGLYDDPDAQDIRPLTVDIDARNTLIVGNSQMGKTNLLMTMLRQLAVHFDAGQIQIYAIDYSSKALKTMERMDIVGGVVIEGEDDRLKSLFKLLRQEIEMRRSLLMEAGATTFRAYQTMRGGLPLILVMLDNYAIFSERYEEPLGDALTFLLREGPALGISFAVTVQSISMINYRRAYLFSQRIAFALSDQGEYASVLEGCRRGLKEVPGRVLIQLDRKIFEGQIWEAFGGRTELHRLDSIKAFVEANCGKGIRARGIPMIPDPLTTAYIEETFPHCTGPDEIPVGMDYGEIVPVLVHLIREFSLSLVGAEDKKRHRFAANFIRKALTLPKTEVWVFDRYDRPLKQQLENTENLHYTADCTEISALFERLVPEMERQLAAARASDDGRPEGICFVIVFNSEESMRYLSEQSILMEQFRRIVDAYRRMKVFFLFSDVPNRPIRYSSPELLKFIGEEKQALLFGELNTIKAFEIPYAVIRSLSGTVGMDDAYRMAEEEITRIKVICETA